VHRSIRTNDAKVIIVTPNIEEGPSEGGLDGKIEDILKDCKTFSVPVVFALTRNKLGKAFGRVSCAKMWNLGFRV
jgi:ribosomal protein L7Ae-like RNA K-turn-binding protein